MENAWRSAVSMEESWQDGGTWMLYTHLPRRHKQLLQTPSVKCLPYRASVGVSDKGVWHAWIDTWPALGRRKQTEVVEGVVLFTLVANELPECECIANMLLQTSPELQHLWLMNNDECKPVRGVPLTSAVQCVPERVCDLVGDSLAIVHVGAYMDASEVWHMRQPTL
eukprot:3093468-Amphidinium_carterae.1